MPKQAEFPDGSAEELLRFCDNELQRRRSARKEPKNRIILSGALLLMMILTIGALMILFSMLRDLPRQENASGAMGCEGNGPIASVGNHFRHTPC
jgi:hypothetical protein